MTSVADCPKPSSYRSRSPTGSGSSAQATPAPTGPPAAKSPVKTDKFLPHQGSSSSLLGLRSTRDRDITDLVPSSPECSYSACYCEENVWKLCDYVRTNNVNELAKTFVVFVSNQKQVVPLWRQRAGKSEEKLVLWDYHVIFVYKPDERCIVFDLDSDLPFPTFFQKYVTETFRTDAILNQEFHRFFRVISSPDFLSTFASDRRHMKNPDGTWMRPPPDYPPISTTESTHNLNEFISMDPEVGIGEVLSLKDFVARFFRN